METAQRARVLLKSLSKGTLTLLTKHYNEFFPMSQNIEFALSTEGEVLFYLNTIDVRNRGLKNYNRAGLYASRGLEAVEIMGRLIPLARTDLRYNRMTSHFFGIHPEMTDKKEAGNFEFYLMKNDFVRYFLNPQEFQTVTFGNMKVDPPISQIELNHLALNFSQFNVSYIDSDGFFQRHDDELKYVPFRSEMGSIDEIRHELSSMLQ